jgi:hypothetical protein
MLGEFGQCVLHPFWPILFAIHQSAWFIWTAINSSILPMYYVSPSTSFLCYTMCCLSRLLSLLSTRQKQVQGAGSRSCLVYSSSHWLQIILVHNPLVFNVHSLFFITVPLALYPWWRSCGKYYKKKPTVVHKIIHSHTILESKHKMEELEEMFHHHLSTQCHS